MSFKKPFRAVPVRPVGRYQSRTVRSNAWTILLSAVGLGIAGGVGSLLLEPAPPSAPLLAPEDDEPPLPQQSMATAVQTADDLDGEQPAVTPHARERSGALRAQPMAASSSWSYPNCSAARAAGATPIYIGQPGYGAHMDGDGDGIACEPYHGQR